MKNYAAECVGTFTLVMIGCGAASMSGSVIGGVGIAFAFGLALIAVAYSFGRVSGGHINPAVSLGMWAAGRLPTAQLIPYVLAQCIGAIAAAFLLLIIAPGGSGLGANMVGADFGFFSAFVFEFLATMVFVLVILSVTEGDANAAIAGLVIGLVLTGIHLWGMNVTGVSVNPARTLGPVLFAGKAGAWAALPMILIATSLGGLAAGYLVKAGVLDGNFGKLTSDLKDLSARATAAAKSRTKKTAEVVEDATDDAADLVEDAAEAVTDAVKS